MDVFPLLPPSIHASSLVWRRKVLSYDTHSHARPSWVPLTIVWEAAKNKHTRTRSRSSPSYEVSLRMPEVDHA